METMYIGDTGKSTINACDWRYIEPSDSSPSQLVIYQDMSCRTEGRTRLMIKFEGPPLTQPPRSALFVVSQFQRPVRIDLELLTEAAALQSCCISSSQSSPTTHLANHGVLKILHTSAVHRASYMLSYIYRIGPTPHAGPDAQIHTLYIAALPSTNTQSSNSTDLNCLWPCFQPLCVQQVARYPKSSVGRNYLDAIGLYAKRMSTPVLVMP